MFPIKVTALLFFFLISTSWAYALEEDQVFTAITDLMNSPANCETAPLTAWSVRVAPNAPLNTYPSLKRKGDENYNLRYSKFGCFIGDKGSLVIAPGRTESSVEFYETALDFIELGYSPVYVIDHRSQGLSPRLLENQHKGHIRKFRNYVSDFKYAVEDILRDLDSLGRDSSRDNLFFTSNSMGGAIGVGYFQHMGASNPFKKAALLGPMLRVNYLGFFPEKKKTWTNNNIVYSEFGVASQANVRCLRGLCDEYATGGDYDPASRHVGELDEEHMTHSTERYSLRNYIWDDFDWASFAAQHYSEDENWSNPQLGAATNRWAKQTANFNKNMRKPVSLLKMTTMPLLIVTGTRDIRAYTAYKNKAPDLHHHIDFCENLNKFSRDNSLCTFKPLEGAFHEIYKESDIYRKQGIAWVDEFFSTEKESSN